MSKPRELWTLKTPAGEMIEYDEPMGMDWKLCSKTLFIEKSAADKLADMLEIMCDLFHRDNGREFQPALDLIKEYEGNTDLAPIKHHGGEMADKK